MTTVMVVSQQQFEGETLACLEKTLPLKQMVMADC